MCEEIGETLKKFGWKSTKKFGKFYKYKAQFFKITNSILFICLRTNPLNFSDLFLKQSILIKFSFSQNFRIYYLKFICYYFHLTFKGNNLYFDILPLRILAEEPGLYISFCNIQTLFSESTIEIWNCISLFKLKDNLNIF